MFLLNDYELSDVTYLCLGSLLQGDYGVSKPTLIDVVAKSIQQSTYTDIKASGTLSAVMYSAFTVIISEWTNVLSGLGLDAAKARTIVGELSDSNLDKARRSRLD